MWRLTTLKSFGDYNTYDKEVIRKVYADVLADEDSFAFFLMDGDTYHGFCHGAYFNTFWLSGMTCYVSSIITNADEAGQGLWREAHGPRQGAGQRARGCNGPGAGLRYRPRKHGPPVLRDRTVFRKELRTVFVFIIWTTLRLEGERLTILK